MEKALYGGNSFFDRMERNLPVSLENMPDIPKTDSNDDKSMVGDEELLEVKEL